MVTVIFNLKCKTRIPGSWKTGTFIWTIFKSPRLFLKDQKIEHPRSLLCSLFFKYFLAQFGPFYFGTVVKLFTCSFLFACFCNVCVSWLQICWNSEVAQTLPAGYPQWLLAGRMICFRIPLLCLAVCFGVCGGVDGCGWLVGCFCFPKLWAVSKWLKGELFCKSHL